MTEELFIPQLGQTVDDVVLISWLVDDGAKVEFGDPILEVETDKAVFNVEANAKGYVHFGPYQIGETLPVLTVVATIGKKDEGFLPSDQTQEPRANENEETPREIKSKELEPDKPEKLEVQVQDKVFASPRAKKLAQAKQVELANITPTGGEGVRIVEADVIAYLAKRKKATPIAAALADEVGLNIESISGTGSGGTVTRADVEEAIRVRLASPSQVKPEIMQVDDYPTIKVASTSPLQGIRKRIFDRMITSDQNSVRVTLVTEADATDLVRFREKLKAEKSSDWGYTPGYNDLLAKIVSTTLLEFPYINSRLSADGEHIEALAEINLGIAVDTQRGLVVPVIKDVDKMDLYSVGKRFRELVEKIQTGKITPDELSGSTFTMTNLGNYDVDAFTPVINPPEVGILGVGRIQEKALPVNGEIKIRKMITLSLVFDHRLIDGAPAARFLQRLKEYVEFPVMIFV